MNFVVPTFHPAFIGRNNARFAGVVAQDLLKAIRLDDGWRPKWSDEGNIHTPDVRTVEKVLRAMRGKRVAYDIETDGQHPLLCQVRCIAFFDGTRAICVPFLYRDGSTEQVWVEGRVWPVTRKLWKPFYMSKALGRVLAAMQTLFDDAGTCFETQNGQYDRMCLKARFGLTAPYAMGHHFDTILAHHIVAGYLPHDLGFLATLYTDAPFYKATEGGDSWASESDAELWLYCCRDVRVTYIAAIKLREELKERAEDVALYQHDAWQESQCQQWRENGVEVDLEALDYFRFFYAGARDKALAALKAIVQRRAEGNVRAGSALETLLERIATPDVSEDSSEALNDDGTGKTTEKFSPASLIQLRLMLSELGVPLTEKTATGELSTAKEFLQSARKELLELGAKPNDDRLAFLDYLDAWRKSSKVYGTYLSPEVIDAGYVTAQGVKAVRVHPSFSVHVVPTGRTSSSRPNFQNQPAIIRGMFVARPGHTLVAIDWDALEMRLGAFLSQDPTFLADLAAWDARTGPKVHILNMCAIFGLPLEKGIEDHYPGSYRAAKQFAYATAYGAGAQTVYEQVRAEMPEMQWAQFLECYERYKKFRKVLFAFQAQVVLLGTQNQSLDSGILKRRGWFWEQGFGEDSPESSRMQNFPYQCLQRQTRVLTSDGYQPIGTLKGEIQAWTGQKWAPAQVVRKGVVPIFRVTLSTGIQLEVDATHQFLVDGGDRHHWRTLHEVGAHRVALDLARPHDWGPEGDVELAHLAGFFIGNGHSSERRGDVVLTVGDSTVRAAHRRAKALLPRLFETLVRFGAKPRAQDSVGCTTVGIYGKAGRKLVTLLGVTAKEKAHTKRVPPWIWPSNLPTRIHFLRGLLDADGCVGGDGEVRLQLCQRELLQEVWLLARTCGVTGSIYGPIKADRKGHMSWVLILNSRQSWTHLGWGRAGKQLRTGQLAPHWVARDALGDRRFPRCTSHQVLSSRIRLGGSTSPYTVEAMGGTHEELYDYTTITKIEPIGKEPVFTLMVEDPQHRYVAEGVIAKNSTGADVVSLANRRVVEQLLTPWQKKLRKGEVLLQLGQIHDELLFEVPERLAEAFKVKLKRIAEEPATKAQKSWNLPVDPKIQRRWKKVQMKCGGLVKVKGKKGVTAPSVFCREAVEIEPVQRGLESITWGGTCKTCSNVVSVEVPRSATKRAA